MTCSASLCGLPVLSSHVRSLNPMVSTTRVSPSHLAMESPVQLGMGVHPLHFRNRAGELDLLTEIVLGFKGVVRQQRQRKQQQTATHCLLHGCSPDQPRGCVMTSIKTGSPFFTRSIPRWNAGARSLGAL